MPMNQQNTATLEDIQSFPLETGRIMDVNSNDARQFAKDEAAEKTMHGNLVYDMVEEEHGDELLPDHEVYEAARRIDGERWFYRGAKRSFDIVFSAAILVLFCWLYAIIAIIIKVDDPRGPVIFKQERVSKNGDRFMMWKFRSMRVNAEAQLDDLVMLNEKTGPVFKISRDPRITRAGRWLRKLSLDELPQFVNVLGGKIPQRIIKTGQGEPCEISGLFALPAKEMRTEKALFLQVEVASGTCLRTVGNFFSNLTAQRAQTQRVFAKGYLAPISGFYGSGCDVSRAYAYASSQAARSGWNA